MKSSIKRFVSSCIFLLALAGASAWAAPVNVNTADAELIADALKGVGPKTAASIVEYREANGAFETVDDLINVKGIGERLLEKIRSDIRLEN